MRTMVKLVLASVLLTGFAVVVNGPTEAAVTAKRAPFSQTALMSRFVRENFAGEAIELAKLEAAAAKVASPDAGLAPVKPTPTTTADRRMRRPSPSSPERAGRPG